MGIQEAAWAAFQAVLDHALRISNGLTGTGMAPPEKAIDDIFCP